MMAPSRFLSDIGLMAINGDMIGVLVYWETACCAYCTVVWAHHAWFFLVIIQLALFLEYYANSTVEMRQEKYRKGTGL